MFFSWMMNWLRRPGRFWFVLGAVQQGRVTVPVVTLPIWWLTVLKYPWGSTWYMLLRYLQKAHHCAWGRALPRGCSSGSSKGQAAGQGEASPHTPDPMPR